MTRDERPAQPRDRRGGGPPRPVTSPPEADPSAPPPQLTVCPLTGRLGLWTALREHRPQPRPRRAWLDSDPDACPFCRYADPDPRLLPEWVRRGGQRWYGVHNIYPPIDGPTGRADLAVATEHDPTLVHLHERLVDDWATMLELQQRLAGRDRARWSMLSAATGRTAGASQHHPHGHVLTPALVPPATIEVQRRWADPQVAATLLGDETTVTTRDGVRLVAPPVPLGPLDLLVVPERPQRFLDVDTEVLGHLVAHWVAGVHRLIGTDPEAPRSAAPFDAKVVVHPELPDGTGRWWAELTVTDRHAPGVAAVPLVDVRHPPAAHAARFSDEAPTGRSAGPA